MSDIADEFTKTVLIVNRQLKNTNFSLSSNDLIAIDPKHIALQNIRLNLREAAMALTMLHDRLLEVRSQGGMNAPTDTAIFLAKFNRQRVIFLEVEVVITSLYSNIYSIRDLIKVSDISSMVPSNIFKEIERLSDFRSKVLVHQDNHRLILRGSRKWHTEKLEFTIPYASLGDMSDDKVEKIGKLFEQCKEFLSDEIKNESNVYNRKNIMYQNLSLFPVEIQDEVRELIKGYGVESDKPIVLAKALESLCNIFCK